MGCCRRQRKVYDSQCARRKSCGGDSLLGLRDTHRDIQSQPRHRPEEHTHEGGQPQPVGRRGHSTQEDHTGHYRLHHGPQHAGPLAGALAQRHLGTPAGRTDRQHVTDERFATCPACRQQREGQCRLRHCHRDRRHAPGQQCQYGRDALCLYTQHLCLQHRECGGDSRNTGRGVRRHVQRRGEGKHPQGTLPMDFRGRRQSLHPAGGTEQGLDIGQKCRHTELLL